MRMPWAKPAAEPLLAIACPRCKCDEFVVLQSAGRILAGSGTRPEFSPARMRVSCSHCLTPYIVRVSATGVPEFVPAGKFAGAAGMVSSDEVKEQEQPQAGEKSSLDTIPGNDPEELVEALRQDPTMRLV